MKDISSCAGSPWLFKVGCDRRLRDNFPVAQVSKRWFRFADTYGVEIAPNENDILLLAVTVCIDAMSHGDEN